MKKKNIIIAGIVIVLIGLGIWYFVSQNKDEGIVVGDTVGTQVSGTDTDTATGAGTTATPAPKGTGTLRTAFTQGGNYTCTIETTGSDSAKTTGTIYASAGKTRTDFRAETTNGTVTEIHVIRDGVSIYTWVSGQLTGTKAALTTTSSFVPHQPSGAGFSITDDSSVNWDCHPWLTDKTQFVPPKGITFIKG